MRNLINKLTVEILFCLMSTLENCLISTYLLWFRTRVQMETNCGATPRLSAHLNMTFFKDFKIQAYKKKVYQSFAWFNSDFCQWTCSLRLRVTILRQIYGKILVILLMFSMKLLDYPALVYASDHYYIINRLDSWFGIIQGAWACRW